MDLRHLSDWLTRLLRAPPSAAYRARLRQRLCDAMADDKNVDTVDDAGEAPIMLDDRSHREGSDAERRAEEAHGCSAEYAMRTA